MTIAICLKVSDVLVFGADSAATIWDPAGPRVYTNAEKIVCLHKELPLGMMVYGLGGMGGRSISSLAKDLRNRFSDPFSSHDTWRLNANNFSIEDVAIRVREFFFDELYVHDVIPQINAYYDEIDAEAGEDEDPVDREFPEMGVIVGGIGADQANSEVWEVVIDSLGQCDPPKQLFTVEDASNVQWRGVEEPLTRLILGTNEQTWNEFIDAGVSHDDLMDSLVNLAPLAVPSMPVQDAIDLTNYLADVAAGYLRFSPGPDVVAPPIDLATITAHEKFKWVKRKLYYSRELNP